MDIMGVMKTAQNSAGTTPVGPTGVGFRDMDIPGALRALDPSKNREK